MNRVSVSPTDGNGPTTRFNAYRTRAASSSAGSRAGVPLMASTEGWFYERAFAKRFVCLLTESENATILLVPRGSKNNAYSKFGRRSKNSLLLFGANSKQKYFC